MSVTVYVENWNKFPTKTVRAYADEEFPSLSLDYFVDDPSYTIKGGRAFTLREVPVDEDKSPYTSKMSYSALDITLNSLGILGKEIESDAMTLEELPELISALEKKISEISPVEAPDSKYAILPSTCDFVLDKHYQDILRVAKIALENKLGIFWI